MMTLGKWAKSADVSKSSVYAYVREYLDELQGLGCIKVKRTPKRYYIYVNDEDCLINFFIERGIYLKGGVHA